ncbi:glycosyltransferase [Microbacterium sp.]|uniref:glycosyltransferase n=1 Tax=Microbacterium sp. TaxID=51671 RepID=UPI00262D7303|nr:glycosyltransferase [Microbacterium sp.]
MSIVVPLFDDEDYVAAALDSCLAQTLEDIEVVCVDDASTDTTVAIVEEYAARDSRVRLIRQPTNQSAFQARRAGIEAATAPYILFLDGDDELDPRAAQSALARAQAGGADVVGFGVEIVAPDGVPTRFEAALQPRHGELTAPDIIPSLFPVSDAANGHLWRYLFASELLRAAYDGMPAGAVFYRANDLPIAFLALAQATKYVSTNERLYRYHFGRGTSGHAIDGLDHFRFLLSGVEPITAIAEKVRVVASRSSQPDEILNSYDSARLHIIGNIIRYCVRDTSGDLQRACFRLLEEKVGNLEVVRAAAAFCHEALAAMSSNVTEPRQPDGPVQSVLLTTRQLDTGGLQAVLVEHATYLVNAGYTVTVAVLREAEGVVDVPPGVTVVQVAGANRLAQVDDWLAICREHAVDVVIDHHILYNENWPWFALAALAAGIPTIGWVHNFALRPLFDRSQRTSFLTAHMRVLLRVVTLSPTDVAFWKLHGIERVVYLPNPPSPLAVAALAAGRTRVLGTGPLRLAWWGRLDRSTKQVHHLIELAEELRARNVDFRLTIIGPDSKNLTEERVRQDAITRGVDDAVDLIGEQRAQELVRTLDQMDLFVSTSAIEGFQLTIIEAQALGMPVVMYDLPWLTTVRDNAGLVTSPTNDPRLLADLITDIAHDPDRYAALSQAAREFARTAVTVDFGARLVELLDGTLPAEFSPAPTLEEAHILMEWLVRIGERNLRGDNRNGGRANSEVAALLRERDMARARLRQITEGPSFRVGRALTFLPRKIRSLVRPEPGRSAQGRNSAATQSVDTTPPPLRARAGSPPQTRSANPDVSFVIPVYNSAPWLDDCISSVLAQTGVDVEVICINDGSTDDSPAILKRFADTDPRVTVIDQENSGQSVGRNRGLEDAAGRYIIYLDSDDYWPRDVLATLVTRADEGHLDLLLFDCIAFRDGDIDDKVWRRYETYYQRAQAYREVRSGVELMAAMRRKKDYRPHVGLYMARTSYVRDLGVRFIPGIVHQDNPYTFRLMLNASNTAHERIDAYARRMRPGSTITTLNAERSARGYYLSYLEMTRELQGRALPPGISDAVKNIVDYVYEGARKQFALISDSAAEELRALDDGPDARVVFASLRQDEKILL